MISWINPREGEDKLLDIYDPWIYPRERMGVGLRYWILGKGWG